MLAVVQTEFRYRGRNISGAEIESVRQLIADHPGLSRRRLSAKLCQAWNWVQANGQLRDMVARSLMLQLHRAGLIVLPAKRKSVPNNAARHRAPLLEPPLEVAPLECDLAELGLLEIRQVRRTPEEALFGRLIQAHHYLGYPQPIGEHLKYLIYAQGQPVAAWHGLPRLDTWPIATGSWAGPGRSAERIHLVAYNTRFLVLPWIKVPFWPAICWAGWLGGFSGLAAALSSSGLFAGDLCRSGALWRNFVSAANWIDLGLTTGRGKNDRTQKINRSRKELWVQPLGRGFRERLCREGHE